MTLFIDKLAIALLAPLGTSLALGVLALLLALGRWRRLGVLLGLLAVFWLGVWSLPVVSHSVRGALESAYPYQPPGALPSAPVAVVLGGGIDPPARADGPANLNAAADRVRHAARLYHAGRAGLLLVSGGSDPAISARTEAAVMAEFLRDLGVPDHVIIREAKSRNTRQNARYSGALLKALGVEEVLLVTSALHMRRAAARFEAEGLVVWPAATDHEARSRFTAVDWLPSADALDGSGRAIKEIVGDWVGR